VEDADIAEAIGLFYASLFQVASPSQLQVVEEALQPQISSHVNALIIKIPLDKEIHEAVLSIHADKAPGPDGFSAGFYHSFWEIVGKEVIREIRSFFKSGKLHRRHNETHVRLIPKGLGAKRIADYRPIALCSVHYKIIAKILSRRLQPILSSLISKHQSAFVPG